MYSVFLGLKEATTLLSHIKPVEANKIKGTKLLEISSKRRKDGTTFIDFVWETDDNPRTHVRVNIVPCIVMFELPRQIRLVAPIPSRRPYFDSQTDFMHTISRRLDSGEKVFFLEARLFRKSQQNSYNPTILGSWGVNIARLEESAMEYIGQMNGKNYFRDIMTVIDRIKCVHQVCLHPVTKRILVNVILHQHRKHLGQIDTRDGWFIKILERLQARFSSGKFSSFFQRKYNLFETIDKTVLKFTAKELKRAVVAIKKNPEQLFHFVGMEEAIPSEGTENTDDHKNDQPEVIEDKSKKATDEDSTTSGSDGEAEAEQKNILSDDETIAVTKTNDSMDIMYGQKNAKASKK